MRVQNKCLNKAIVTFVEIPALPIDGMGGIFYRVVYFYGKAAIN